MADSSPNSTEVAFAFPTSGMIRRALAVAPIVFATCLTALVCLLMCGAGRMEFSESIFTTYVIFTVASRESVLM